ncbi:MMPL family transporter [Cryptosporangium aurantiacum]|uniref:Putative drug exporter of the RND superfamily n=1 Tax=Cryptosporangium aurantiacum TaxID=134849 RepID=A0A1M7RLK0_9ACTN|nr:MMPL family transporter [Cryptosporangium aurantiacum]SHN47183.1 putative drug exporter of the RND superfamily [Cryptosporangium aurantiacum]
MMSRIGQFCFRYRFWVLGGWLVLFAGGVLAAGQVLDNIGAVEQRYAPESVKAGQVLDAAGDRGDQIVALFEGVDPRSPDVRDAVTRASDDVARIDGVRDVDEPVLATDSSGVALQLTLSRMDDDDVVVEQVSERLRRTSADVPGMTVRVGGNAVLNNDVGEAVQGDLARAEVTSLPLIAILLVLVFGGLIIAGVPLLATLASTAGAFAVLFGFSQFVQLDGNVITVVTLLSLGLSVDYGLLLVARYREELIPEYRAALAAGKQRPDRSGRAAALRRAWGTAGRTVVFSSLTIAAALSGLLLLKITSLQAMAAAGISVALVAMFTALTFTAAMLAAVGRWVRPSRRTLRRIAATPGEGEDESADDAERGFFARLAGATQRRPLLVMLGTVVALIAAGAPLLGVVVKQPLLEGFPRGIESVAVADDLSARYGRTVQPAVTVVARTSPDALDDWAARWRTDQEVIRVEPARAAGPDLSVVVLAVRGDAQGDGAQDLVRRLRADRPAGGESWVTGSAASLVDTLTTLRQNMPWAILLTLVAMSILLFLMTGSVVVPLQAIVTTVVSLGATFGVLVGVFQHGWLSGLLDTRTVGGLSPFVIGLVFAFAFGLSMDYQVFLLSRIKEYVDGGVDTATAVRRGLQRTGRIITSAALLMLVVFGCFGAAKVGDIEVIGIGLFVAVLVDVTIVRCLLVPATMSLLGGSNWWAPRRLRTLHTRYGLREASGA